MHVLLKFKSSSMISVDILLFELTILINYKRRGLISDSKLVPQQLLLVYFAQLILYYIVVLGRIKLRVQ